MKTVSRWKLYFISKATFFMCVTNLCKLVKTGLDIIYATGRIYFRGAFAAPPPPPPAIGFTICNMVFPLEFGFAPPPPELCHNALAPS